MMANYKCGNCGREFAVEPKLGAHLCPECGRYATRVKADGLLNDFERAYYIKLGTKGVWEALCIKDGLARVSWRSVPLSLITNQKWTEVEHILRKEAKDKGSGTRDLRALRRFCESTSGDVWMTFHDSLLWWCRLADGPLEEDTVSKFRRVADPWSCTDVQGHPLLANQVPGAISARQRFPATVCAVKDSDALGRLINGEHSPAWQSVEEARCALVAQVTGALQQLHWKDFETLVDLLFRQAGWRRKTLIGEVMKFTDMELEEPVTKDTYQVQVKARADKRDYEKYRRQFSQRGFRKFRKLYFVVHSPSADLAKTQTGGGDVELILGDRLSEMIVDFGLVGWLLGKVR